MSQEQHPATPYYPAPWPAPPPPQNLTVYGVLAFASAAAFTVFAIGGATVSARAMRYIDDPSRLDWSVPAYFVGYLLELASLVAGWVTGSLWLHRARRNAELLNPAARHARSSGWAWGGWLVPVVALWFPFQVVRDVRKAVTPFADTGLVGCWWAAFLVLTLTYNGIGNYIGSATAADAEGVQAASWVVVVLALVALPLWGQVLRTITREQHARMYAR